jgi:lysophospholipase L1-like esterase
MFECLIIGDSIAVGTKMFMPQCLSYASSGITSWHWDVTYGFVSLTTATTVVISLGSNDGRNRKTVDALFAIRNRTDAGRVIWIVPTNASRESVIYVATKFGDKMIEIKSTQPDKIHPDGNGYKAIVEEIKK